MKHTVGATEPWLTALMITIVKHCVFVSNLVNHKHTAGKVQLRLQVIQGAPSISNSHWEIWFEISAITALYLYLCHCCYILTVHSQRV